MSKIKRNKKGMNLPSTKPGKPSGPKRDNFPPKLKKSE